MEAVTALYSNDDHELSAGIMASLSCAVFEGSRIKPAGWVKRCLSRVAHRALQWTTRTRRTTDHTGSVVTEFKNRLLERSGHPYARSLLTSSNEDSTSRVEGGDPMIGPYMMLAPEIRTNCGVWDKLFLDSVQCRDVQSRIIWETRSTYDAAKCWLDRREPVRLKAVAAGTGLSMMLVYDQLIREGFDPDQITVRITDNETANIARANRLLDTLAAVRRPQLGFDWRRGISAATEDIFETGTPSDAADPERWDVVTAIGILEYFQGYSYTTTEKRLGLEAPVESVTAHDLVRRLTEMATDGARLILNTYRDHASTRILELFGKRFHYRGVEDLRSLLASVSFQPALVAGSGNIYDVNVYERSR